MFEVIRGACQRYTGLSGYQKGVLMFHVDGVFQAEDSPANAMIEETQRQITEALPQSSAYRLRRCCR